MDNKKGGHLAAEINWFEEHRTELLSAHPGKWAVVFDRRLIGIFETPEEAYSTGVRTAKSERILVKKIVAQDEKAYVPALVLGVINATCPR
jgi:hypothetical protein